MRCEDVRERRVATGAGGGAQGGRGGAAHRARGGGCRKEYDALRNTLRLGKDVRGADPGGAFWQENRQAILAAVKETGGRRHGHGYRRLRAALRPLLDGAARRPAVALLTALTLLGGASILRDSGAPDPANPAAAISAPDREALGDAYLEGTLFAADRPADELAWLSVEDLADVVRAMAAGDGGTAAPAGETWAGPGWGTGAGEIGGLEPEPPRAQADPPAAEAEAPVAEAEVPVAEAEAPATEEEAAETEAPETEVETPAVEAEAEAPVIVEPAEDVVAAQPEAPAVPAALIV